MKIYPVFAFLLAFVVSPGLSNAGEAFVHDSATDSAVPIPASERALQSVEAKQLLKAGNAGQTLEGAQYDRDGNLYFCNVTDGKVMRVDGTQLAQVFETDEISPGGLAFHKDGRLFVSGINQNRHNGAILAVGKDGRVETVLGPNAGYMPNDLVFDKNGGIYFSDFRGSATKPDGGVYYITPDFKNVVPIIPNMAQANGVALSPDGKMLWATEYARNLLHRVNLSDATHVPLTGSKILYHFTGPAPDSMRVDRDGNVYVALVGQGRVLVFNPAGIPIGHALLPGRDQGLNLRSTSLALHPRKNEMAIVSGNTPEAASKDASVFIAPAFAPGQPAPAE